MDYHAITSKQVYSKINTIITYELSMRSTHFDCILKKSCFLFVLNSRSQYSLPILQFCRQKCHLATPFFMFCLYGISFTEKIWDLPQKKTFNGRGPRTVMTAEDDGRLQRRQHPGRWGILGVPLNQFTLALKNKLPLGYLM